MDKILAQGDLQREGGLSTYVQKNVRGFGRRRP
jgi:hypothetical protein